VRAKALFVVVGMEHFLTHGRPEESRRMFGRSAGGFEINP